MKLVPVKDVFEQGFGVIGQAVPHSRILEKLGEGGMDVVDNAYDVILDGLVALTFLPSDRAATEQDRARLMKNRA